MSGPIEEWIRRWGRPNEDGSRVYFTGEIDTWDSAHPELGPDTIVPIFEWAKERDAEVAALRTQVADLRAALEVIDAWAFTELCQTDSATALTAAANKVRRVIDPVRPILAATQPQEVQS